MLLNKIFSKLILKVTTIYFWNGDIAVLFWRAWYELAEIKVNICKLFNFYVLLIIIVHNYVLSN